MNSTLTTARSRQDHPPQQVLPPVRRVSTLDRLALHLGIALIKWGRRPYSVESRERRASRIEQQLARLARARVAERQLRLTVPLR